MDGPVEILLGKDFLPVASVATNYLHVLANVFSAFTMEALEANSSVGC